MSLGYLDVERRELVTIPGFLFENSEDILHLDKTQVIRVSTKLERLENTRLENVNVVFSHLFGKISHPQFFLNFYCLHNLRNVFVATNVEHIEGI